MLDTETKQYFDRQFAGLAEHLGARIDDLRYELSARLDRLEERVGKLEERVGALEERVLRLEQHFDRFELRSEERFESVFDYFRVLDRRLDNIEASLVDVRAQMATLTARVDGAERRVALMADRMHAIEKGYESLDARLALFADDVRQRFRVVNDRLAALAN
jgi:chromosome segregation ATPase